MQTSIFSSLTLRLFLLLSLLSVSVSLSAQLPPRSISSLDRSADRNRPLPLEEAFPYFVSVNGDSGFNITWTPAAGHYLYRHAFAFSVIVEEGDEPDPVSYSLPDGLKKTDQFFGDIEAYYDEVKAEIQLETGADSVTSLVIEYQGCADWGFCYPPQRVSLPLSP